MPPEQRRRVLILKTGLYTGGGGERAFYRNLIADHEDVDFHFPAVGAGPMAGIGRDIPPNAVPFVFSCHLDIGGPVGPEIGDHWYERALVRRLSALAAAIQGMTFHLADLPPSLPAAHLLRPVFAGFGVYVETVAMGMPRSDEAAIGEVDSVDNSEEAVVLGRIRAVATGMADIRYRFGTGDWPQTFTKQAAIALVERAGATNGAGRRAALPTTADPPGEADPAARAHARVLAEAALRRIPLISPPARDWRPPRREGTPRVSVIVPVRRDVVGLAPTLACLARVEEPAVEVVVVDHGSQNPTLVGRIVDSFAPLARLIRMGDVGEAAALNRGLEAAGADYLAIVDSGDRVAPELFSAAVGALDASPGATGAYPDWGVIDAAGFIVHRHRVPDFDRELLIQAHWCFPGPLVVLRRAALEDVAGWDTTFRFLARYDLLLRVTRVGPLARLSGTFGWRRLGELDEATRLERAAEHVRVIERLLHDSEEPSMTAAERDQALAAARLAAVAMLGTTSGDVGLPHPAEARRVSPAVHDQPSATAAASAMASDWRTIMDTARPISVEQ